MIVRLLYLGFALVGFLACAGCTGEGGERPAAPPRTSAPPLPQAGTAPRQAPVNRPVSGFQRPSGEFLAVVPPRRAPQEIELVSVPMTDVPTIDGRGEEPVWQTAPAVTTLDFASQRAITLRSVHTDEQIFFLVSYPDPAPSQTHKTWGWDATEDIYKQMRDREDVFVLKWSLVGNHINLAFRHAEPHRADIWFWKARRTNPAGYADDKWHTLAREAHRGAQKVLSDTYGTLYLRRLGDSGRSAYEETLPVTYQSATLPKYVPRQPQGSRADIRAKGVWHEGTWTIEFGRKLDTGHEDDIALTSGGLYLFAVSCYEMAHGAVTQAWSQPLYKAGDAFDRLLLRLATKHNRLATQDR